MITCVTCMCPHRAAIDDRVADGLLARLGAIGKQLVVYRYCKKGSILVHLIGTERLPARAIPLGPFSRCPA